MTLMESAPLTGSEMHWPIPPEGGYFAEDLDTIPDLPPHTELIDGSLVFVAAQVIFWAAAETSLDQSDFKPEDVLLVVEVVSAESRVRDRERKPQLYAGAGFQRYWRIEKDRTDGRPVVYARVGSGYQDLRADRHPPWPTDRVVAVPH
jgi:hypothetical protein